MDPQLATGEGFVGSFFRKKRSYSPCIVYGLHDFVLLVYRALEEVFSEVTLCPRDASADADRALSRPYDLAFLSTEFCEPRLRTVIDAMLQANEFTNVVLLDPTGHFSGSPYDYRARSLTTIRPGTVDLIARYWAINIPVGDSANIPVTKDLT
jgi:hypothetical protein